jgi:hypothetical protein
MPQRPPRQRLSSNALVFTNIASPPQVVDVPPQKPFKETRCSILSAIAS